MGTIVRTPIFTVPDQPDFHDDIPQVQPLPGGSQMYPHYSLRPSDWGNGPGLPLPLIPSADVNSDTIKIIPHE